MYSIKSLIMHCSPLVLILSATFFLTLIGCKKNLELDIPNADPIFVERLEGFFNGSEFVSSLFADQNPSSLSRDLLEYIKSVILGVELGEIFIVDEENYHLAHPVIGGESSLYWYKDAFYRPLNRIDGVIIIESLDGTAFSIPFFKSTGGSWYVPGFEKVKLVEPGIVAENSYVQYSFVESKANPLAETRLLAEIQLKCSVRGKPYESRHGIFYSSGIMQTPAGGIVHEITLNFFSDLDGMALKVLSGRDKQDIIFSEESNISVSKGDSVTFTIND